VWPLILQGTVVTVVAFVNKRKAGWTSSVYALYGDGVLPNTIWREKRKIISSKLIFVNYN
jgi:hypothetical protein